MSTAPDSGDDEKNSPPEKDERINDAISELIDDDTRAYYVTTLKENGDISCNWEHNPDNNISPYPDLLILQAHLLVNYAKHVNASLKKVLTDLVEAVEWIENPDTEWVSYDE